MERQSAPQHWQSQWHAATVILSAVGCVFKFKNWATHSLGVVVDTLRQELCMASPELPSPELQKLRGHAGYYGITGNSPALARFYHEVLKVWRKWLMRRRRAWRVSWDWFRRLLERYPVPYLRTVHSKSRSVANG